MPTIGNIRFYCILWSLFMGLYFFFSTDDAIWNTAFYTVTILLARNNTVKPLNTTDVFWKKIGVVVLDILLILFWLFYLTPDINTEMFNNIIGSIFVLLPVGGLIYEGFVKR